MKKAKVHIHPLFERIIRLEASLLMAERRLSAQQHVLSWLLARHPGDEASSFLAFQAFELEKNPKFEEDVALLDELREDVSQWRAQRKGDGKFL